MPEPIRASETFFTLLYAFAVPGSQGRPAASAADRPVEIIAVRYARNGTSDVPFQHRPPGHQRELQRLLDQGEATARQIDRPAIDAIDPEAGDRLDEILPDLGGDLASDPPQFPVLENRQDVLPEPDVIAVLLHQPLFDQPLLSADQCLANVAAEAVVGAFGVELADELPIKPGRALMTNLPLDRQCGQGLDRDGPRLREPLLVVPDPVQVVGRDRPGPIPVPLNGAGRAPDRLQPSDVGLDESLARGRVMLAAAISAITLSTWRGSVERLDRRTMLPTGKLPSASPISA